jgi:hypothetical protein
MTGLSTVRMISHGVVRLMTRTGSGGHPTDRWQDKSAAFCRAHMVGRAGVSRLRFTLPAPPPKKAAFPTLTAPSLISIRFGDVHDPKRRRPPRPARPRPRTR